MTQPKNGADGGAPGGALAAALTQLVSEGTLTTAQARAVTREFRAQMRLGPRGEGEPAPRLRSPWTLLLAEIGGYVGGAFVLGAAAILLSDHWNGLGPPARFGVLAVPALALAPAAVITARTTPGGWRARVDRDPTAGAGARRRLVSLFAAVAAVLAGGSAAVVVDARHASGDWAAFAFSWTSLFIALAAYLLCRAELLHTVLGVSTAAAAVASVRVSGWYGERATGWAFVVVGAAWGAATVRGLVAERGLGFGWAGVLVFVGAELLTPAVSGYAVLALLTAAGILGFTWGRSLTLLVIGVLTLAVVVPQAVIEATDGTLTSSGALLVVGLSIVAASALGFRLHARS